MMWSTDLLIGSGHAVSSLSVSRHSAQDPVQSASRSTDPTGFCAARRHADRLSAFSGLARRQARARSLYRLAFFSYARSQITRARSGFLFAQRADRARSRSRFAAWSTARQARQSERNPSTELRRRPNSDTGLVSPQTRHSFSVLANLTCAESNSASPCLRQRCQWVLQKPLA